MCWRSTTTTPMTGHTTLMGSPTSRLWNQRLSEAVGSTYLEQGLACNALAAGEVLARLRGRPGYKNAYTDKVDQWVAKHRIDPPSGLITRGETAIVRILGPESELREIWEDAGDQEWRAAVDDLWSRMSP